MQLTTSVVDDISRCIEFILVQPQEVSVPRLLVFPARQECWTTGRLNP